MALKIKSILSSSGSEYVCRVCHGELEFTASINYDEKLEIGSEYFFELGYESIRKFDKIPRFNDEMSGIFPTVSEEEMCVIGKISGVFSEADVELIDLYIQKGPEFVTVDRQELSEGPYELDNGVKVVFKNLKFYLNDKSILG